MVTAIKNTMHAQDRTKEIEFWDKISTRQRAWVQGASSNEIVSSLHSSKEHWWEPMIGQLSGKKILDIGCGDTYFVAYWNLSGNQAQGSDFSPATVETNNLLHEKLGLPANFYITSSEKIEGDDNSFDIIHMRWVVHHIPPELHDASIREMRRVLKPGGQIIAFETNYYYPFRWLVQTPLFEKVNFLRKHALKREWLDPEERALPNKKYIDLFKRNGFKIKKVGYDFTLFAYPVYLLTKNQKLEALVRKIDFALGRFITPRFFSKDIKIIAEKI